MNSLNNNADTKNNPLLRFFSVYFSNFSQIILTNLLFFLCCIPAFTVEVILYFVIGRIDIVTLLLLVPMISPLSGGLIMTCRKIAMGERPQLKSVFWQNTKKNVLQLTVHGIIMYAVLLVEYFALTVYFSAAKANPILWIAFVFMILLGFFILFCMYSVPIMIVTIDLKLSKIYKNAALLTFGALTKNLSATLVLTGFVGIIMSVIMVGNWVISLIMAVILAILVVPATVCVIVSFNLYPKIKNDIADGNATVSKPSPKKTSALPDDVQDDIPDELLQGNPDEMVFFNGKMLKRSALISQKLSQNKPNRE